MTEIIFATGNDRKVWQAQDALKEFGITIIKQDCEIDEIQSSNPEKISIAKAKAAYVAIKKPVVINDHHWSIPALGGFPGGYMKDINQWFGVEDFLALLVSKTDRTGILTENVVYFDGQTLKQFSAEFTGKFISEPRGEGTVVCERIFAYDNDELTIAEHIDRREHARAMDKSAWKPFGEWYAQKDL